MRAVVLLKTNPGFQEKAYSALKAISVQGARAETVLHCFGRFDGVIVCEYNEAKALAAFTEALRCEGVFHTETLIPIE